MYNAHRGMPGANAPQTRYSELLEQLRQEFEAQVSRATESEHQVAGQIHEMEAVRNKVYQLEQSHLAMKAKYEEELARLRLELEQRGGSSQAPHAGGPATAPPPAIGHGPSNLFPSLITTSGQGGPGLAPMPPDQQGPPGLPTHVPHQPGPPGLPPHNPFPYNGQPTGINGYGPPATQAVNSPGPVVVRPPGQPNGNQQQQHQQHQQIAPDFLYTPAQLDMIGNQLSELEPDKLPPSLKRVGDDWHVVYNPRVRRQLEVDLVHNLPHQSVVCCVRFSHDGRFVATGCNRSAQIFDVSTGKQVCHLQDGNGSLEGDLYIRSVCFSPDGRTLATGAEDKIIRVWDIATKQVRHTFPGHDQDIYSLDFSSDGRYIASGSGDRSIRLWDIQEKQCVLNLQIEDGVTTVAISGDGRFVAAGSLDKSVRIWDTQTAQLVERTEGDQGHSDSVYSVAFSPTGTHLVSGSLDKTIRMWKLNNYRHAGSLPKSGDCVRTFEGHKDFVLSVALTPDGQWVMSGSKDRGVQFWDPATGDAQLMLQGHKNSVISVAPSPKGGLFATGSGDMKARIWRYQSYTG